MDDTLKKLKNELSELKADFARRTEALERKIRLYESREAELPDFDRAFEAVEFPHVAEPLPEAEPEPLPEMEAEPVPASRSVERPGRREVFGVAARGMAEKLLPVSGPVAVLWEKFRAVYRHYHAQGKAPVFFMTIAGILTLVMGFGYLFQYSFSRFLGPAGKVGLGFGAAAGIVLCGVFVTRKRPDMDDYGSALIGLGVILAYLCTYFAGPFYHLVPDTGTFILLTLVTAGAYGLALAFKTRIVAVVSLFGGVFAPLLMAGGLDSHLVYLSYVFVLMAAMLDLSRRIAWPVLGDAAMVTAFLVIEAVLWFLPVHAGATPGMAVLLHLFFYLFCGYQGLEILVRSELSRRTVLLFSSNLFFFLFALNQVVLDNFFLGGAYLANGAVFGTVFWGVPWIVRKADAGTACEKLLWTVCLMSCGLLAGFGILAGADPELLGLVWGIEALALLVLGCRFDLVRVRLESYVILVLAFLSAGCFALAWIADSLVEPPRLLALAFGRGWLQLMVAWGLAQAFVFLMARWKSVLSPRETVWLYGWDEGLSLCISLAFCMTVGLADSRLIWLLAIVPMFFLIHRSKRKGLPLTEFFGLAHYLLFLVPMALSAVMVESFYFNEQMQMGKIVRVEAFLCLYGLAEFYRRFHRESSLNTAIQVLRPVFFCIIPVCFLPGVRHLYPFYLPLALWLSAGICLALFWRMQYPSLLAELKLLVLAAVLGGIGACGLQEFYGWQGHGFPALVVGLGFLCAILFGLKGLDRTPKGTEAFLAFRENLSVFFPAAFYYAGVFLFILVYAATGSPALGLTLAAAWFCLLLVKVPALAPLERNGIILYPIVGLSAAVLVLAHLSVPGHGASRASDVMEMLYRYGLFSLAGLGLFGLPVHLRPAHIEETKGKLGGPVLQFRLFHVLACLAYIGILGQWFQTSLGPALSVALVVHATLVLFLTLKARFASLVSLAVLLFAAAAGKIVFFDMHDFSLVQKMTAFIIIGALLLGAAYLYQRIRSKQAGQ